MCWKLADFFSNKQNLHREKFELSFVADLPKRSEQAESAVVRMFDHCENMIATLFFRLCKLIRNQYTHKMRYWIFQVVSRYTTRPNRVQTSFSLIRDLTTGLFFCINGASQAVLRASKMVEQHTFLWAILTLSLLLVSVFFCTSTTALLVSAERPEKLWWQKKIVWKPARKFFLHKKYTLCRKNNNSQAKGRDNLGQLLLPHDHISAIMNTKFFVIYESRVRVSFSHFQHPHSVALCGLFSNWPVANVTNNVVDRPNRTLSPILRLTKGVHWIIFINLRRPPKAIFEAVMSVNSYKLNHRRRINESFLVATKNYQAGVLAPLPPPVAQSSQTCWEFNYLIFFIFVHIWKMSKSCSKDTSWMLHNPEKKNIFNSIFFLAVLFECNLSSRNRSLFRVKIAFDVSLFFDSLGLELEWISKCFMHDNDIEAEKNCPASAELFFFRWISSSISVREMFSFDFFLCLHNLWPSNVNAEKCKLLLSLSSVDMCLIVNQASSCGIEGSRRLAHLCGLTWGIMQVDRERTIVQQSVTKLI